MAFIAHHRRGEPHHNNATLIAPSSAPNAAPEQPARRPAELQQPLRASAGTSAAAASVRTVALPPFLTALLRQHLARHPFEFVFTTPSGTWLWRSTFIRRVLRPAIDGNLTDQKAAVRVYPVLSGLTFHGLRHSQKTWLIAGGAPEIAQARRLGHHLHDRVVETCSHIAREV